MNIELYITENHRIHIRRYQALDWPSKDLADKALTRYINACQKFDCLTDDAAICEMIVDASKGLDILADEFDMRSPEAFQQSSLLATGHLHSFTHFRY